MNMKKLLLAVIFISLSPIAFADCASVNGKDNLDCEAQVTHTNNAAIKHVDIVRWMQLNPEGEKQMSQAIPNWRDILKDKKFQSWKAVQSTPINDLFYSKEPSKLVKLINIYLGKDTIESVSLRETDQNKGDSKIVIDGITYDLNPKKLPLCVNGVFDNCFGIMGKYSGEFHNGNFNGYGLYRQFDKNDRNKTDKIYLGEFKNDRRDGQGILFDKGHKKFEGHFDGEHLVGFGVSFNEDGTVEKRCNWSWGRCNDDNPAASKFVKDRDEAIQMMKAQSNHEGPIIEQYEFPKVEEASSEMPAQNQKFQRQYLPDPQQTLRDRDESVRMMQSNGNRQSSQLQSSRVDCSSLEGFWNRFQCAQKETAREQEEAKLDKLRFQCDGFGFQRGTNEYAQCMMKLQAQENANDQAVAARLHELSKPPQMINLTPQTTRGNSITCRSSGRGIGGELVLDCQ